MTTNREPGYFTSNQWTAIALGTGAVLGAVVLHAVRNLANVAVVWFGALAGFNVAMAIWLSMLRRSNRQLLRKINRQLIRMGADIEPMED